MDCLVVPVTISSSLLSMPWARPACPATDPGHGPALEQLRAFSCPGLGIYISWCYGMPKIAQSSWNAIYEKRYWAVMTTVIYSILGPLRRRKGRVRPDPAEITRNWRYT